MLSILMKTEIIPALRLTFVMFILFVVIYPLALWSIAQTGPNQGRGEALLKNGKIVGFANVGQSFTADKYFWSRPSAVAYNAAGSGGSNKGPTNPAYLAQVQARIDTFLVHNAAVQKSDIPTELVTASGSGLDPHLSPQGADVQIARIAKVRGISEGKLHNLVKNHTEQPLLGLFGTAKVNVLKLNLALDEL